MPNQIMQGFRLTPQQRRLWSLQQHNSAFFTQCALLIAGNLKLEVLKAALEQVVIRHGILRTTFQWLAGMKIPVMAVANSSIFSWHEMNWSHWEAKDISSKIADIFQEARSYQFDFEQGPLLHLSLLKLSENNYILLISLPALCADTWTVKNLVTEISNSYSACLQGEVISEEVVQYLQFSEWQNQLLEDEDAAAANEYWNQQKLDTLASLKLPFENKVLQPSKFEIDCYQLAIAPHITSQIVALADKYNTYPAVVLLACWQTLIWRLTGQPDIVIGMASDRRDYEELHQLLGLVASWIPIKSYFTPDLRFQEVLELAHQTIEAGAEWQDYFVPEARENHQLAFSIGFEFEQLPEKLIAGGVSFSLEKYYSCIEQFKIKLTCTQREDYLTTEFYYDINYFSGDIVERISRQFETLLTSVTANPEQKISQLEILNSSDRQQLIVEFNQTSTNISLDKCIHQLFAAQVEKTPDKIAVVFEEQQLTYAELNRKANQLAHYLQQRGVKPEVLVGLCVERSPLMIIGLLGILKAGGAYLPLDPTLPKEGFASRLQDTQTSLILTQQRLVDALPTHVNQIVCLDTDWDNIAQSKDENPTSEVTAQNLVYVLFTSGSTGKAKGVAIEHRQILNYLHGIIQKLDLSTTTNFATVSTLAADLGNTCIFAALATGGCLHILSSECATDATALAKYCRTHPIDCLKIVPSHLATLLTSSADSHLSKNGVAQNWDEITNRKDEAVRWAALPTRSNCRAKYTKEEFLKKKSSENHPANTQHPKNSLGVRASERPCISLNDKSLDGYEITSILPRQQLILGGEVATWQLIEQIRQQAPSTLIYNHYGPTEATVGVTTFAVTNQQTSHTQIVPLGRPLANTQIYLLDEQLQPVPIGVPGELYIGGAGLARGYLNQADLTAAKFIPNPFAQTKSDSRLYKTGDIARYLPDGNIEFIGRADYQVKIRGFRIELGEIESTLCQHPQVQQAVVIVREEEFGNKFLIAYVVTQQTQTLSVSELQRFLREKLPEYMMPSTFVMLKALPLTSNGKVNRSALPEPNHYRPELAATYEPPQTEVEQTIANIWQQMLHIEKVGIHDNFFDIGGHSLLLVQVHAKLREIFPTDISVINLFEFPTINSLAKYLTQKQTEISSFEESTQRAISRTASRQSRRGDGGMGR